MKRLLVDFDHTLARTIEYPYQLRTTWLNRLVRSYVRRMKRKGWEIILNTCREGQSLDWALRFCSEHNIPIDFVNQNTLEAIQIWNSDPRKIAGERSIDDTQIGLLGWLLRRFA